MPRIDADRRTGEIATAANKISRIIEAHPEDILVQSVFNDGEGTIGSLWVVFQRPLHIPEYPSITNLAIHVCPQTADLRIIHSFEMQSGLTTNVTHLEHRSSPFDELHKAHTTLLEKAREVSMHHEQFDEAMLLRQLFLHGEGKGFPVFDEVHWRQIRAFAHTSQQLDAKSGEKQQFDMTIPPLHWAAIVAMEEESCVGIDMVHTPSLQVKVQRYGKQPLFEHTSRLATLRTFDTNESAYPSINIQYKATEKLSMKSDGDDADRVGGLYLNETRSLSFTSAPLPNGITSLRVFSVPDDMVADMRRFVPIIAPMPI